MFDSRSKVVPPQFGQARPGRHELLDRPLVPGVGAVGVEHRRRLFDQRRGEHRSAAGGAVHRRDRHAPGALARDAPVGAVGDHPLDPRPAPAGDPARVGDGLQGPGAQVLRLHGDEPLGGGQEDHRLVAAPAVRVLVVIVLAVPQPPPLGQGRLDLRVRVPDLQAGEQLDGVVVAAGGVERGVDLQPVLDAGVVVVGAVARGGVHRAGAGVQRDVVTEHAERVARVEGMAEDQSLHHLAVEGRQRRAEGAAGLGGHRGRQVGGDDDRRAADVVGPVLEVGMERDREVVRDGPRRGRPDQHRHRPVAEPGDAGAGLGTAGLAQRKLDVDRRRDVRLVLDLGLGQRGAILRAPVHRLLALVDHVLGDERAQRPDDRRLVAEGHRQVRLVPQADDARAA